MGKLLIKEDLAKATKSNSVNIFSVTRLQSSLKSSQPWPTSIDQKLSWPGYRETHMPCSSHCNGEDSVSCKPTGMWPKMLRKYKTHLDLFSPTWLSTPISCALVHHRVPYPTYGYVWYPVRAAVQGHGPKVPLAIHRTWQRCGRFGPHFPRVATVSSPKYFSRAFV